MEKKNLEVLMDGKKEYVSLSVKVVDIHLSDCINASPIMIEEGTSSDYNRVDSEFGSWGDRSN